MKFLVTGAKGQLGQAVCRYVESRGYELIAVGSNDLDITDAQAVHQQLEQYRPDFLINCAAYTAVDKAESEQALCHSINADGPENLAASCQKLDIKLLHVSTDYVFDGNSSRPYSESDPVNPLGVYGRSKWLGEENVRRLCPRHIIVRVSWVFGPDGNNFMKTMLRLAKEKSELKVVDDQLGCPSYTGDIARVLVGVAEQLDCDATDHLWGTYHYCGSDTTSWHRFAQVIIQEARRFTPIKVDKVLPITTDEFPTTATRPQNSSLYCRKILNNFGIKQRPWRQGVMETLKSLYPQESGVVSEKAS